ncbi:GNAT family N-acetyltransferase [Deinococcota bacterium DY0809b]
MRLPEKLESERLVLRPPQEGDLGFLFGLMSDPEVVRFLGFRPVETREDERAVLERWMRSWTYGRGELPERPPGESLTYLVTTRAQEPLGTLSVSSSRYGYELAYALARSAWGRGYMPEAVRTLSDWLLSHGAWRVFATCHVDNVGSQRTLEKAGFEREGRMRRYFTFPNLGPEPADGYLYAKVAPARRSP